MISAPLPLNEESRLRDLYFYDILDTPAESDFDDLVELASHICQCPISLISLLDKDRQWFKARSGWEELSTPRDIAFCSHVILQDEVMVIEDSKKDERFHDNPLVDGDMDVRFYAAAPIISPTGHKLGAICIIDHKPKTLSPEQQKALSLLSNQATKLLEIRRKNIMIRKRAEEEIVLKSQAIKKLMQETENDKKDIASNLHEGFAQEIASSIFYLNMGEQNEATRLNCLRKAKEQLHQTLVNMRELSSRITPLTADWLSPQELVAEFIDNTAVTYPFQIEVETEHKSDPVDADISIAAIRIMEKWLKVLSHRKDITSIHITITADHQLELKIEDNGSAAAFEEKEKELTRNALHDKVTAYEGDIHLTVNTFRIILPLSGDAVNHKNHSDLSAA
jgi:hypothetical protein